MTNVNEFGEQAVFDDSRDPAAIQMFLYDLDTQRLSFRNIGMQCRIRCVAQDFLGALNEAGEEHRGRILTGSPV